MNVPDPGSGVTVSRATWGKILFSHNASLQVLGWSSLTECWGWGKGTLRWTGIPSRSGRVEYNKIQNLLSLSNGISVEKLQVVEMLLAMVRA